MASRWALRWLALVSVFVAVQLRMLLSQRAPGARAAPRVGAPARNGTARRCAVAAVAPSRRPLERELHAAWVEAAARALEAFAFDEPPCRRLPRRRVLGRRAARGRGRARRRNDLRRRRPVAPGERRGRGALLGPAGLARSPSSGARRASVADLLFLPGAAPDLPPPRRKGLRRGQWRRRAGAGAAAPRVRAARGGAGAARRAAAPVDAAFASAVDFWVRPDVAAFLAALAEDAGDAAGWRLLEARRSRRSAAPSAAASAARRACPSPSRRASSASAARRRPSAARRGARPLARRRRRRRRGRRARPRGRATSATSARTRTRSRRSGRGRRASPRAAPPLAEAVGVACGGSAAVRSHAVLVPRACCCPLATRRRDAFDRDLLKRAYRLGALAGDPNPDARDVARNKHPAYLHYWYGL
ncbi:hypothetical protein JL722_5802 [Aureococcus anophagefferens]|nr:hypothetical protein JL722_5802 [Aureococcus anophagefferens]